MLKIEHVHFFTIFCELKLNVIEETFSVKNFAKSESPIFFVDLNTWSKHFLTLLQKQTIL